MRVLVLMVLAFFAAASPAWAQRIALIITNGAYAPLVGRLNATHGDGDRMAAALDEIGFQVHRVRDTDKATLENAIVAHAGRVAAAGPDAVGFVYYSGHGASTGKGGRNYLIPVSAPEISVYGLPVHAVPLDSMLESLSLAGGRAHIVVFDACRDVPVLGAKGAHKGMASIPERRGMVIGFSAEPGAVALDTPTFSTALSSALRKPGLDIVDAFREARFAVQQATGGTQFPVTVDRLTERLCLNGECGVFAMRVLEVERDPCDIDAIPEGYRCVIKYNGEPSLEKFHKEIDSNIEIVREFINALKLKNYESAALFFDQSIKLIVSRSGYVVESISNKKDILSGFYSAIDDKNLDDTIYQIIDTGEYILFSRLHNNKKMLEVRFYLIQGKIVNMHANMLY